MKNPKTQINHLNRILSIFFLNISQECTFLPEKKKDNLANLIKILINPRGNFTKILNNNSTVHKNLVVQEKNFLKIAFKWKKFQQKQTQ